MIICLIWLYLPPESLESPNIFFFNSSYLKSNKYERDWSEFDQEILFLDLYSVCWDNSLVASSVITDDSHKTFLGKFESLLDTYAPL